MCQVKSDHDCDVGLWSEEFVFGKSEDEALEDFVGDGDPGLPEDQPQVEARGLGAGPGAGEVFAKGSLQQRKPESKQEVKHLLCRYQINININYLFIHLKSGIKMTEL